MSRVDNLDGIATLNLTVDGTVLQQCSDFVPAKNSLLWPVPHELRIAEAQNS